MAFPVTIDSTNTPRMAQQNTSTPPMKSSVGSFYAVLSDGAGTAVSLNAYKADSDDPSTSFTEQDTGNRPDMSPGGNIQVDSLWDHQDGDKVYCATQDAQGNVMHAQFDMSGDTWVAIDGASDRDILIEGSNSSEGSCSIAVEPTGGSIKVIYAGDSDGIMGTPWTRVHMGISADDGETWTVATNFIGDPKNDEIDYFGGVLVLGSSDRIHGFAMGRVIDAGFQRTIAADDSLESAPSAFDATIINANYTFGPGISYDDGGTQRVRCPYGDSSRDVSIAKFDSADAPTVTTDASVSDNDVHFHNGTLAGFLAADGTTLHLLYSDSIGLDLFHDENDDDGGWGTDTNELTATIFQISGAVYERSGQKLGFVYNDPTLDTVKWNEIALAAGSNQESIVATATGVPAIHLHVFKVLAATAVANPTVNRKTFKTLAATAFGVTALVVTKLVNMVSVAATAVGVAALQLKAKLSLSSTSTVVPVINLKAKKILESTATGTPTLLSFAIFSVVLAVAATGVASLTKKAKLNLSDAALGVVTLAKKAKLNLNAIATGTPNLIKKAKLILGATTTGVAALVVQLVGEAIQVAITAVATAVAILQLKVKKGLEVTAVGVATLSQKAAFKIVLQAFGAGIAGLNVKTTFRKLLAATAVGIATLSKKAKINLSAMATGNVTISLKAKKILQATAAGIAALITFAAERITLAVVAIGLPALHIKVKKGISVSGQGVASIKKFVRKALNATATGIATLNNLDPNDEGAMEAIRRRVIGFFGGPGGGPGR